MSAVMSATGSGVRSGSFYTGIAVICLLIAFLGFVPTYWAPLAAGRFAANPVVHIHGMVFFGWMIFFLVQTMLPPAGNVALHRSLGLLGISLATAMVLLGVMAALNSLQTAVAFNAAVAGEAFTIVPLAGIGTFGVLVALAIANVHRPEVHKRLMLCATVTILGAPLARPLLVWVLAVPPGPPPVWINWDNLIGLLLVVAAMIHDRRTRGSVHPVYLVTFPVLLFITWVVIPLSETAAWHAVARAFLALAGHTPLPPG